MPADPQHPGVVAFGLSESDRAFSIMRGFITEGFGVRRFQAFNELAAARDDPSITAIVSESSLKGDTPLEFCRNFRSDERGRLLPLVMLQSANAAPECSELLIAGADSCLSVDASSNLVLATVRSLLRRTDWISASAGGIVATPSVIASLAPPDRGVVVDLASFTARLDNKPLDLTTSELRILVTLSQNAARVVTRSELFNSIRHTLDTVTDRSLDSHVYTLRRKMGDAGRAIKTLRGLGYRWDEGITPVFTTQAIATRA